jgi:hypothetical protein
MSDPLSLPGPDYFDEEAKCYSRLFEFFQVTFCHSKQWGLDMTLAKIYSRFHNDRHPRFLLVYVLFGSIGESSAKEALADNLPWRITPTERLPHASEHRCA